MHHLIYHIKSGEILSQYTGPESQLEHQLQEGYAAVAGEGSWLTHKVVNGKLTKLAKPRIPPTAASKFDFTTGSWYDNRSLEEARTSAWERIKAKRVEVMSAGFEWKKYHFDSDLHSRLVLQELAKDGRTVPFLLADNTELELSPEDLLSVAAACTTHISAAHARAQVLRAKIFSAPTVKIVDSTLW